jgi:hypothetical protein
MRTGSERQTSISSVQVVEPLPTLLVTLSNSETGSSIVVDGVPGAGAMEIPWGPIIDLVGELAGRLLGGDKAGSGTGCTTIKVTNPDGSSTTITQCPPPSTT